MSRVHKLNRLEAGQLLLTGGDGVVTIDEKLAAEFQPGDALRVVEQTGQLLHIPAREQRIVSEAVGRAHDAFRKMGAVDDARPHGTVTKLLEPRTWRTTRCGHGLPRSISETSKQPRLAVARRPDW